MKYLFDTNVISETVKLEPNKAVIKFISSVRPEEIYISVISLGEIRKGLEKISGGKRQKKFASWLEETLPEYFGEKIIPIDRPVADRWGKMMASLKKTLSMSDSLIAASALAYDLTLVTRNEKDFANMGIDIINPWNKP